MKVTRDVIFDLLPAYFGGDASPDTRALVEEFFATDAEFGRMARRFKTLFDDRQAAPPDATEASRERDTFDRARLATELPLKARTAAFVWAAAGSFSWLVAFLTWTDRMGFRNPGLWLGAFFLAGAAVCFGASFVVTPESAWRGLIGLDDESLRRRRIER